MRPLVLAGCLLCFLAAFATAQVSITESTRGWELTNGHIHVELSRASGNVHLKSLRREGGAEWAVADAPLVASPDKASKPYVFADGVVTNLEKGGKQLTLHFQSAAGGLLSLKWTLYPDGAVIQTAMQLENRGQRDLLLDAHISPLLLMLRNPAGGLKPFSSIKGEHGFHPSGNLSQQREFPDWLVLENEYAGESMLVGGEPGLGVLGWKAYVRSSAASTVIHAGTILIKDKKSGPSATFELASRGNR